MRLFSVNVPSQDKKISKWGIFYYVYGMLHHSAYREKFAGNLKRDLPRLPFAKDFGAFSAAGKELARLHLDYEQMKPFPLKWIESKDVPLSYRVEDKMRLSKDKKSLTVNPSLTLTGIPPEVFQYRLGSRSALEWVIDQLERDLATRRHPASGPKPSEELSEWSRIDSTILLGALGGWVSKAGQRVSAYGAAI